MGKFINYVVLPFVIWIFFLLAIIFIPKLATKKYLSPILIFFIMFILLLLIIIIEVILLKYLPDIKDTLNIEKKQNEKLPYADLQEIEQYNIQWYRNHATNPINLKLAEDFRQEGIMTVGKRSDGDAGTEVCVAKYKDVNPFRGRDIYYIANRVLEPNKMKTIKLSYQPTVEEENKIIRYIANCLATKPENMKETSIILEKTPSGSIIETRKKVEIGGNQQVQEEEVM